MCCIPPTRVLFTLTLPPTMLPDVSLRVLTAADVDKVIDALDQSLAISSQKAVFAAYSTQRDATEGMVQSGHAG